MHINQLAQYVDTHLQLGGNKLSSSTASKTLSSKHDNQHDRHRNQARNCSSGCRTEAFAVVAHLKIPPADWENSSVSNTQHVI